MRCKTSHRWTPLRYARVCVCSSSRSHGNIGCWVVGVVGSAVLCVDNAGTSWLIMPPSLLVLCSSSNRSLHRWRLRARRWWRSASDWGPWKRSLLRWKRQPQTTTATHTGMGRCTCVCMCLCMCVHVSVCSTHLHLASIFMRARAMTGRRWRVVR
jgi:hypothetical protein